MAGFQHPLKEITCIPDNELDNDFAPVIPLNQEQNDNPCNETLVAANQCGSLMLLNSNAPEYSNGSSSYVGSSKGHLENKISSQQWVNLSTADVASSECQDSALTNNTSLGQNIQELDNGIPVDNAISNNTSGISLHGDSSVANASACTYAHSDYQESEFTNTTPEQTLETSANALHGDVAIASQGDNWLNFLDEMINEDWQLEKIKFTALDPEASEQKVQNLLGILSQYGCPLKMENFMEHEKRLQFLRDLDKELQRKIEDDSVHFGDNREMSKADDRVDSTKASCSFVTSNDPSSVPSTFDLLESKSTMQDARITVDIKPNGSSCLVDENFVTIKVGEDLNIDLANALCNDKVRILVQNSEGTIVDKAVKPCKKHAENERFPHDPEPEKLIFYIPQKFSPSFEEHDGHPTTQISLKEDHFLQKMVCLPISFKCCNSCEKSKVFSRRWILKLVVIRGDEVVYEKEFLLRVCGQPKRDHEKDLRNRNSMSNGKGQKRSAETQDADFDEKEQSSKTGHCLKVKMSNPEDKAMIEGIVKRLKGEVHSCPEQDDE